MPLLLLSVSQTNPAPIAASLGACRLDGRTWAAAGAVIPAPGGGERVFVRSRAESAPEPAEGGPGVRTVAVVGFGRNAGRASPRGCSMLPCTPSKAPPRWLGVRVEASGVKGASGGMPLPPMSPRADTGWGTPLPICSVKGSWPIRNMLCIKLPCTADGHWGKARQSSRTDIGRLARSDASY